MPIRLLSEDVASQIAAGEVVERPASVVKELIENSLDAGAKSIQVGIADAGRRSIEVADDGVGIPRNELALAVARHATSKLSLADDLSHIRTLGFRGEALASIASVSRFTLTSRTGDSAEGAQLWAEAGTSPRMQASGGAVGTTVRVEDLFANVPARLKFLKSDATERRAIDQLITRYALAYPAVRFKLVQDGSVSLQTTGDGDRRAMLAALYGVDVASQLLEIAAADTGADLTGFVSPTSLTRSNRREITFFVNGRWVHDAALVTAAIQAYHTLVMVGRYPMAVLFLDLDPADVDVNVHPAKAEVRFRSGDRVFSFVQRAIKRGLLSYSPVPSIASRGWIPVDPRQTAIDPAWTLGHQSGTVGAWSVPATGPNAIDQVASSEPATTPLPPAGHIPLLRLIGQIGLAYLVAEGPDGLYLIDQHAAHERVLFEKLMQQHDGKNIASQSLLAPVTVTLPGSSSQLLAGQLAVLRHLGFAVEEFGPNTFQVREMPILFGNTDPAAALRALVEDFEEDETPLQSEMEARIAARVCKRMAVRAGMALSGAEQRTLLADLEQCTSPRTCPHGRPTMIHLSVDMLEQRFGRRGAR